MKYSVIIPTYNCENTINRCLDSILNQNNNLAEIIIINDGSIDNTEEIIKYYNDNYSNRHIINQNNKGPGYARNVGIDNSNGKYLIFVDSDDYISNDYFETIDNNLIEDIDLLKYNANYYGDRVSNDLFITPSFETINGEEALGFLLKTKKIFSTPWLYVFKKELFTNNNIYFDPNHLHEDYSLIPCVLINANTVKGIDYIGYNYVYSKDSLSTSQDYNSILKRANDMLFQYDYLKENVLNNIKDEEIKNRFNEYIRQNLINKLNKLKGEDRSDYKNKILIRK